MSTADAAWISAGSGLAGALIGAGASTAAQWIGKRTERDEARRVERRDAVIRFTAAAEVQWRATVTFTVATFTLNNARGVGDQDNYARARDEWQAASDDAIAAHREVALALMTLQLLAPQLNEPAVSLRLVSQRYELPGEAYERKWGAELEKFLQLARAELDTKPNRAAYAANRLSGGTLD